MGKAGDPLPAFKHHMIRQRVDRHGMISHLEPEAELVACNMPVNDIGVIKEGPVKKWMAAKAQWDTKYASSKRKVQKQRAKEMAKGYYQFGDGEVPPPSALAGRRTGNEAGEEKKSKSMGMSLWALWGSKHDEKTAEREQKADQQPGTTIETTLASSADGANARSVQDLKTEKGKHMKSPRPENSRSRSRRRTVTDQHQTGVDGVDENTPAAVVHSRMSEIRGDDDTSGLPSGSTPAILIRAPTIEKDESDLKRPKLDGIAYPFTVKQEAETASMMTLTSDGGVLPTDEVMPGLARDSGIESSAKEGMETQGKGKEVATGLVGERPQVETFVTAYEDLPTLSTQRNDTV